MTTGSIAISQHQMFPSDAESTVLGPWAHEARNKRIRFFFFLICPFCFIFSFPLDTEDDKKKKKQESNQWDCQLFSLWLCICSFTFQLNTMQKTGKCRWSSNACLWDLGSKFVGNAGSDIQEQFELRWSSYSSPTSTFLESSICKITIHTQIL